MGLYLQESSGRLVAVFHDALGKECRRDISPVLCLGDDVRRMLKPILDSLRLMSPASIRGQLKHLKLLGAGLTHLGLKQLPTTEGEWQILVIAIYRYIITRTSSTASLKTRVAIEWMSIRGLLKILVEAGIIPVSTYLPPAREALDSIDISPYKDRLLGQSSLKVVGATTKIDKLMCSVSLSRTDAEYLEELRDTLSFRRHLLLQTLTKHWQHIKANITFGRELVAGVDWGLLEPLIEPHLTTDPKCHPAYPSSRDGLANYLAVLQHKYKGWVTSDDDFRNLKSRRNTEFIPRHATFGSFENVAKLLGAPDAPYGCGLWSSRVIWWWLGRISHFDISVLTALLIMLHPSWTPTAVMLSRVTNRDGKQYLDFADDGFSYEINKQRAKDMKRETLDPLAYDIISTLIEVSAPIRHELSENGDPKATLLFLPYGNKRIVEPIPSQAVMALSGKTVNKNGSIWLGIVYPELIAGGLDVGMLSFKKIRNTEGVLEWFRTKSLRAVSRKLGNTEKVVLEHYIPKPLLDAWNTRIIRRFQNLWISVAVANEVFLLDVTDFKSLADIHSFLRDMLHLHGKNDSPLAELLHEKFGVLTGEKCESNSGNAHLHVDISKVALSTLYSYQAAVIDLGLSGDALDRADIMTGLSPRHFMSLADLLQTQLPYDKNPEYVACHIAAMKFAGSPENRKKIAILMA